MTVFYLDTSLASSTYYYLYLLFVLYLIIILLILLLSADIYNIYEALNQDFIVSTIYKYIWKDRDNNNDIICRQYILKIKNPYRSDICRMLCLAVGVYVYIWLRLDNQYCKPEYTIPPISLTFGRQCDDHTNTGRLQMPTHAPRQYFGSRVFFSLWRLVRTASALCLLRRCEGAKVRRWSP